MEIHSEVSHHAETCYCTMCRDENGNQHPISATFKVECDHDWKLTSGWAAACVRCGTPCFDSSVIHQLRDARAKQVEEWKRAGK